MGRGSVRAGAVVVLSGQDPGGGPLPGFKMTVEALPQTHAKGGATRAPPPRLT